MPNIPFLFLIAFLVGADEFLLGPILTPIGADLSVPPQQVALFITAYSLPLAILAPVFGLLSDRYGRLAVLVPATLVFGLASIGTSLAATFETGLATRVVTGTASGGMLAIALALAGDMNGAAARRAIAWVTSGLTLGILLSPGLGALAAKAASWRCAFLVLGCLALPTALAGLLLKRQKHAPSQAGRGQDRAPVPVFVPGAWRSLAGLALGLGGAVGAFALVGERLRDLLGWGTELVGLVYVAFGCCTLLGNLAMPRAVKRVGNGRRVMRLALGPILAAIILTFAPWTPPAPLLAVTLAVWAVLGGLGAPALQSHLANLNPARRGTLMALGGSCVNLGIAASSALAAALYGHGAAWVAAASAVLLGLAILFLRPQPGEEERVPGRPHRDRPRER